MIKKVKQLLGVLLLVAVGANVEGMPPVSVSRKPSVTDVSSWCVQPSQKPGKRTCVKVASGNRAYDGMLYGNLIYRDGMDDSEYGIYHILPESDALPQLDSYCSLPFNGGGVWLPETNTYIAGVYVVGMGQIAESYMLTLDADTWEVLDMVQTPASSMSWDLCYNPYDSKVYGSFTADAEMSGVYFGTLDTATGNTTFISDLKLPYAALAAAGPGEMYGIEQQTGNLYRIGCDGTRTLIGATGTSPAYYQSATFDYSDGTMYWMACLEDSSALYTVDISDGSLALVNDLTDTMDEWVGLFSRSQYVDPKVPAAVSDLNLIFDGAALSGKIKFTVPTVSVDGTPLQSALTYTILIDDRKADEGNASAGSEIECDVFAEEGLNQVTVFVSNESGKGISTTVSKYVGYDLPDAPSGAVMRGDNGSRHIEWDPVTTGSHGGTIDAEKITYSVMRLPDNIIVADGISDCAAEDNEHLTRLARYHYEIRASYCGRESEISSTQGIVFGDPVNCPFSDNFSDSPLMELYEIEDTNNDGCSWHPFADMGNMVFRYKYSEGGNKADDWLFSIPVFMEQGKVYPIDIVANSAGGTERMEVWVGTSPRSSQMTDVVIGPADVTSPTMYDQDDPEKSRKRGYYVAKKTGTYYVGFHVISDPNLYLFLREWSIGDPLDEKAPASPGTVSVRPADKGDMEAEVLFTAPVSDCVGNALDGLEKIIVTDISSGRLVGEIANPVAGQMYTLTDDNPTNGMNYYKVAAYNTYGEGMMTIGSAWVGLDVPLMPENAIVTIEDDGAHIDWTYPATIGMHGGYIDTKDVKFFILSSYPYYDMLATDLTDTRYVDTSVMDIHGTQVAIVYQVYARNSKGRSDMAITNTVSVGTPLDLPYHESFRNGLVENYAWLLDYTELWGDKATWVVTDSFHNSELVPHDSDGGMLVLDVRAGGESVIASPQIAIPEGSNAKVSFWGYRPVPDSNLAFMVSNDHGVTWDVLSEIEKTDGGWEYQEFALDAYSGSEICIGFKGCAISGAYPVAVDDITVFSTNSVDKVLEEINKESLDLVITGNLVSAGCSSDVIDIFKIDGTHVGILNGNEDRSIRMSRGVYIAVSRDGRNKKFVII